MLSNLEYMEELDVQTCIKLFLAKYKDKSKQTYTTYRNGLEMMSKNIFGKELYELNSLDIQSLTWNVLESYKLRLLNDNKNSTVNNRITAIKQFIRFVVPRININYDTSQLDLVENLSDDRDLTPMIPEELLMKYAEWFEENELHNGKEKKWICLFLFETGIRAESALNVSKSEFEKDGKGYILRTKDKGKKSVKCKVGEEIYNEIMNLNPDSDKVFSIQYKTLSRAFERANAHFKSKIEYTAHSIRKLAITNHYKVTGCIISTKEFANHSSIATTQRYLDLKENLIDGAYTRSISTEVDMYKDVDLATLVSAIDTLPSDIKDLINLRVKYKK